MHAIKSHLTRKPAAAFDVHLTTEEGTPPEKRREPRGEERKGWWAAPVPVCVQMGRLRRCAWASGGRTRQAQVAQLRIVWAKLLRCCEGDVMV